MPSQQSEEPRQPTPYKTLAEGASDRYSTNQTLRTPEPKLSQPAGSQPSYDLSSPTTETSIKNRVSKALFTCVGKLEGSQWIEGM